MEIQRLAERHAAELLRFERENRDWFTRSISDRGDDYFAELPARHAALLEEQAAGSRKVLRRTGFRPVGEVTSAGRPSIRHVLDLRPSEALLLLQGCRPGSKYSSGSIPRHDGPREGINALKARLNRMDAVLGSRKRGRRTG